MIHYIIGILYESSIVVYYPQLRAFDDVPRQEERPLGFYRMNDVESSIHMTINLSL